MSLKQKSLVRNLALVALLANGAAYVGAQHFEGLANEQLAVLTKKSAEVEALKQAADAPIPPVLVTARPLEPEAGVTPFMRETLTSQRIAHEMEVEVPTVLAEPLPEGAAVKLTFDVKGKYTSYELFWSYFQALKVQGIDVASLKVSERDFEAKVFTYAKP